jgi:PAS domain S-box-containing protein
VGIPLITSNGFAVGVLCVLDRVPRKFTDHQVSNLKKLANQVVVLIELQRTNLHLVELEQKSAESEQRLSFALDAADVGDWNMDMSTNFAVRSLKHDQCFGYTQAAPQWGYDTFLSHVDPHDRERVDAVFKSAMSGNGDYDVEFKTTWPDGTVHWLWSKGRFYFDNSGKPYRAAGIQVDVTKRVLAEKALIASNSRYKRLFETSLSAILIGELNGNVLFANPAACNLFGLTQEEICKLGRGGLVSSHDPRVAELLKIRDAAGGVQGQLTMVRGDGTEFEAEISTNVYTDEEGMARTNVTLSDITEKVRLLKVEREQHEQLEQIEAHHQELLQNLNTGIVVHAPDTQILFSNDRASELLGLSIEQMQGKTAIDPTWCFVYEDGVSISVQEYPVNQVLKTLKPVNEMILGVRRPDRVDLAWLLVHAFPEMDERGQLRQIVVNFHDITQRKNAESQTWTEANFDHLTRLPNRRLFHDRLEQKLRQSQRDKSITALMFLDLDHFKDVNDTQGHDTGDQLLVEAAQRIKECIRDSDSHLYHLRMCVMQH